MRNKDTEIKIARKIHVVHRLKRKGCTPQKISSQLNIPIESVKQILKAKDLIKESSGIF